MDEKTTGADLLYAAGVSIYESSLKARLAGSEATDQQKECIKLFQEALSRRELDASTEIQCRVALAVVLFDLNSEHGLADLGTSGLESLEGLDEAVRHLEKALTLDAQTGTRVFSNRILQSMAILRLNAVWQYQSFYIKNQFGPEQKLSYLKEKLKLLEYLGGVKPPNLCLSLAFYYRDDMGNRPLTLEWLKNAAAADDYADIDGESSFYKIAEYAKQAGKKGVQQMSTPRKTASKPLKKESTGGCFIATATYGSPLAPEVMVFREFRDDLLLSSRPGRILVRLYYSISPYMANFISKAPFLRLTVRSVLLHPLLCLLKRNSSRKS